VSAAEQLSNKISELDPDALEHAAIAREKRLSPLFRRWPALSGVELAELMRLYNERVLIAKYLGRRRGRQAAR
jgi:hypothetical protein